GRDEDESSIVLIIFPHLPFVKQRGCCFLYGNTVQALESRYRKDGRGCIPVIAQLVFQLLPLALVQHAGKIVNVSHRFGGKFLSQGRGRYTGRAGDRYKKDEQQAAKKMG